MTPVNATPSVFPTAAPHCLAASGACEVWAVGTGVGFLAGLAAVGSEAKGRPDFLVSHMGELPT